MAWTGIGRQEMVGMDCDVVKKNDSEIWKYVI